ncbi:hypothetical protein ACXZ65_37110 [Streptomyces aculeolatus]
MSRLSDQLGDAAEIIQRYQYQAEADRLPDDVATQLLTTPGFKCNNTACRPVMDALALPARYVGVDGKTRFYDAGEAVPRTAWCARTGARPWWTNAGRAAVIEHLDRQALITAHRSP